MTKIGALAPPILLLASNSGLATEQAKLTYLSCDFPAYQDARFPAAGGARQAQVHHHQLTIGGEI